MATTDLPFPTSQTASSGGAAGGSGSGAFGSPLPASASPVGSSSMGGSQSNEPWPPSPGSGDASQDESHPRHAGSAGGLSRDGPAGSDVLSRVVQGAHHTIDRLADAAAPHVQKLQQGVSNTSNRLSSQADDAREAGDEWAESLRVTVREHPLAAIATAVALGVILSRIGR